MALLDGMLGGAQSVMAFGQQQTQNKLARDRYDLDASRLGEQKRQYDQSFDQTEKKNAEDIRQYNLTHVLNQAQNDRNESQNARLEQTSGIERTKENERQIVSANDKLWKTYKTAGLLTADGLSIDRDVLTQRVKDGDPVAEQVILGMATQFGDLPEGSTATEIRPLPNGGYAVTVLNADGSDGVITEDGSSEPNSTTVNFEPGQLSRLAAAEFGMNVITNTSVFDAVGTVNQTNKFEADANRQSILDQLAALREQRDVLNSLPPGGLKRGAKFAVANAESPEAAAEVIAQIKIDSGNAQPATASTAPQDGAPAQTDTQAPAQTDTQAPTATTPWSMDSVDRSTTGGGLIASLEGVAKDRTANPRAVNPITPAGQTEKLMARKAELEKSISTAEKLRVKSPNFKVDPEQDGLPKNKAELAQINAYIDKDKPALFTSPETDSIATATEGKTGDEILKAVDNGEIQISKDEQLKIAQALKDNKINELKDMLRLNAKEQAVARVAILASEKDPTIRAQMSKELSNLFDNAENSPSMSRKDEIDDKATDRTYRLARANYNKSVNDALTRDWETANEAAATLIETTSKLFFGDNGDEQNFNAETANMLFKGPALNGFMTRMKRARTQEEKNQYMMGLNASISLGVAGLAGEQDGGISESIADFFVRGEVTDNNNPIDFDLRRVRANDTKNPTTFYYTDADGNKTDESIEGEDLRGISASVYEIVRKQAIANTPTPKGQ